MTPKPVGRNSATRGAPARPFFFAWMLLPISCIYELCTRAQLNSLTQRPFVFSEVLPYPTLTAGTLLRPMPPYSPVAVSLPKAQREMNRVKFRIHLDEASRSGA